MPLHKIMNTNLEAAKLIADLQLSHEQVAQYLNVSTDMVCRWLETDNSKAHEVMSQSDLHFLKYCLMTDNKRSQLF
jgi:DNA-binding transcriptional regulator YiaG